MHGVLLHNGYQSVWHETPWRNDLFMETYSTLGFHPNSPTSHSHSRHTRLLHHRSLLPSNSSKTIVEEVPRKWGRCITSKVMKESRSDTVVPETVWLGINVDMKLLHLKQKIHDNRTYEGNDGKKTSWRHQSLLLHVITIHLDNTSQNAAEWRLICPLPMRNKASGPGDKSPKVLSPTGR